MRELPRDLVTILRTEAKNQRNPPVDYVIAEDGGRMVHYPEPDIAMAELLEEAATALAAKDAELAAVKEMYAREGAKAMLEPERAERAEAQLAEARKALDEIAAVEPRSNCDAGSMARSRMRDIARAYARRNPR